MEKKPKLFNKGMSIDTNEEFQPEGSYRFMLNGILESSDGDKGSVINELGNDLCFDLPEIYSDYNLIGACLLSDNRIVLFFTNDVTSIIGIQDIDCTFTVLISSNCLNFSSKKPIDCIFKLQRGCDYVLYFTDNYNKYKSININNLDQYKPDGINWDCTLMNISPDFEIPDVYFLQTKKGGRLRVGAYQFVLRYLDDNLNPTNWMSPTNPIYITQPPENTTDLTLNTGGILNVTTNDGFVYTNKSIELKIKNLDTRYKYYQIGILESTSGASTINNAFITNALNISSSSDTFTLTEISPSRNINSVDSSEITVPNLFINQIAAHAQIENRLLLANHQEQINDWSQFQRLANEIQTEYFVYNGDQSEVDQCDGYYLKETTKGYQNELLVTTEGTEYLNVEVNETFVDPNISDTPVILTNVISSPSIGPNPYNVATGEYTAPSNGYYQFTVTITVTTLDPLDATTISFLSDIVGFPISNLQYLGTSTNGSYTITRESTIVQALAGQTMSTDLYITSTPVLPGNITVNFNLQVKGAYSLSQLTTENYKNYSLPEVSYDNKTYMRDEIYALGIVFVFKDGFESPVFHIPGRIKIGTPTDANDTAITTSLGIDGFNYTSTVGRDYWGLIGDTYNISLGADEWDTRLYPIETFPNGLTYQDTSGLFNEQANIPYCEYVDNINCTSELGLERWEQFNTSIKNPNFVETQLGCKHVYNIKEIGIMSYYDTNTTYPDVRDCNGVPIYPHDTIEVEGEPTIYRMHKIRHHHMPDARKVPIHSDDPSNVYDDPLAESKCEEDFELYPIGVKYSNIDLTFLDEDVRDQIQGYYFVRGDRAGNKTVIDKGWMNVTDVTYGINNANQVGELNNDNRTIEVNKWFMTPGWKNGMGTSSTATSYEKLPEATGWNVVEFFSPKTSFGEITNVGGDYYKLERTVYGFFNIKSPVTDDGQDWISAGNTTYTNDNRWRLTMYGGFNKSRLPRGYNFIDRVNKWSAAHRLPIQGSEYTIYNENNSSSVMNNFKLLNNNHRQTIMISKLFNESLLSNGCSCQKPQQTAVYTGTNISSGVEDIIPWDDIPGSASNGHTSGWAPSLPSIEDDDWIREGQQPVGSCNYGRIGRQFCEPDGSKTCRKLYSPFAYYVALKNNIKPYTKLENIKYVKTSNYIIEIEEGTCFGDSTNFYVTGGDCFISKQFLYKSYAEGEAESNNWKLAGSVLWGYVESEINSHYRHKEQGDDYYAYPFDSLDNTVYTQVIDVKDGLRTNIEQLYKYRLDYSKDNNDRLNFPLADEFAYCSDCSGSFPHVVYYSEQSFTDELQDKYRIFRALNNRTIPSDTGDITNLIIKEENLFAFTENNLWRFNVAPQQLQTNNDTVQIGQGSFLGTRPVKLFDNKQGTARGGMEFKFSGVFGGDNYFWVDNLSGKVFSLSKGVEEISQAGMKRFFRNNLMLKFRDQFKQVSGGLDYPTLVTTSPVGVGFHGVYDPQYMRYILHKRDFTFTEAALDETGNLNIYTSGVPAEGVLYYVQATESFIIGDGVSFLTSTPVTSFEAFATFFKNESFTVSYSIVDKVWTSFHSYLPTFMYHDFDNFYTYYAQNNSIRDKVWKHNSEFFTTYCDVKESFVIDIINNQSPYVETSFDTIEYTSNVFEYDLTTENWREIQLVTFDRMFVYNNNQISNLKNIIVSNPNAYQHIQYNVNNSYANKDRNFWRINRFRDMAVNRLTSPESLFTKDWAQPTYRNNFSTAGIGWIDKVVNPNIISINKDPYRQLRFTDKYLGTRLFFKPNENYKITFNLGSNIKRNKT